MRPTPPTHVNPTSPNQEEPAENAETDIEVTAVVESRCLPSNVNREWHRTDNKVNRRVTLPDNIVTHPTCYRLTAKGRSCP